MKIIGIDLGTRRMAACHPESLFVWSVDVSNAAGKRSYLTEFEAGQGMGLMLLDALDDHGLDVDASTVWVAERPLVHHQRPNIRTAVGMSLSAGAAMATLPGQVIFLNSPSTWKKELCGNGSADKPAIRAWVEASEPTLAALCGEVQDRYDAVGIALGSARLAQDGRL